MSGKPESPKKSCKSEKCKCDCSLNTSKKENTFVGVDAGKSLLSSRGNTVVGWSAGSDVLNCSEVEGAVLLGKNAGNNQRVPKKSLFVHKELAPSGGSSYTSVSFNAKTGQIVPAVSSLRFKENVRTLEVNSSLIFDLVPKTFNYKAEYGGETDFGYIAEETDLVLPEITSYDGEGPYSVRYDILSVLAVKELAALRARVVTLEAQVDGLLNP